METFSQGKKHLAAGGFRRQRLKDRYNRRILTYSGRPFRGSKMRGGEDSCGGF